MPSFNATTMPDPTMGDRPPASAEDTQAPASAALVRSAALDILVANLAGHSWLEPQDWFHLQLTCKTLMAACEKQTKRFVPCQGQTIQLFQWGMASPTEPRLYISLPYADNNTSRSFGWKGQTTGSTHWYKIRFSPHTMMVHTGDYTFARKGANNTQRRPGRNDHVRGMNAKVPDLGELAPIQVINVGEFTPYATCYDCSAPNSDRAISSIDLRGTPFAVQSEFKHEGYRSNGSWTYTQSDQCVRLTGGGYCGLTVSKDNPGCPDDSPGAWALKLKLLA